MSSLQLLIQSLKDFGAGDTPNQASIVPFNPLSDFVVPSRFNSFGSGWLNARQNSMSQSKPLILWKQQRLVCKTIERFHN